MLGWITDRAGEAPDPRWLRERCASHWADLREDKMSGPGFSADFRPLGAHGGPGTLGNGPGSKNSAGCTKHQTRRPIISPIRGHFVFLVTDRKKILR
jgi:hypothetical protein